MMLGILLFASLLLLLCFAAESFLISSVSSSSEQSMLLLGQTATPIDGADWPAKFPAKDHCSRCGLCETTFVSSVKEACALLPETGMSRMHALEEQVHGRRRDTKWQSDPGETAEEGRFGVMHEPMRLAKGVGVNGAQWTGVVTGIALSMLETGKVDAVVCIANENDENSASWASPEPILARTAKDVLRGRGVKPALAPSLRVLDEIQQDDSIERLLFCGVGCAVQAFRAVQAKLKLKKVYVLGTNCVDNSPTPEAAEDFLRTGVKIEEGTQVRGYEFMQDFKVHVKTDREGYVTKPYFSLPGTIAAPSIATSCLSCFDYTNGLADVVVGYMGAPLDSAQRMDEAYQTLTVRNDRGSEMVEVAKQAGRLDVGDVATGKGRHEQFAMSTVQSDSIVQAMVGGKVMEKGMPVWAGNIMAFALKNIGPKGVHFARYSIDYHLLRNYLHVLDEWGEEAVAKSLPGYAREIVELYLENDESLQQLRAQILAKNQRT